MPRSASRLSRGDIGLLAMLAMLAIAQVAPAMVDVKLPLSKVYRSSSRVVIGKVTAISAERQMLLASAQTVKGESVGEKIRVAFPANTKFIERVAVGQPVVLFVTNDPDPKSSSLIQVADEWFTAIPETDSKFAHWTVTSLYSVMKPTFPGRTVAVVHAVEEYKSKKSPLLDKTDEKTFPGGARELAKLDVTGATFLAAADVNGDAKADLLIGTGQGVRLMLANSASGGKGYADAAAAWGLTGASGTHAAFGDVNGDGKPDLLLDDKLFINDGHKFTRSPALPGMGTETKILATALADMNGDGKPDALVLLTSGELLAYINSGSADASWKALPPRSLWQGAPAPAADAANTFAAFGDFGDTGRPCLIVVRPAGVTRYALDDEGGGPADYERLVGERFAVHKSYAAGVGATAAVALDYNGDGHTDFLAPSPNGSLLLVNRGLGAFLSNAVALASLATPPSGAAKLDIKPTTRWCAASLGGAGSTASATSTGGEHRESLLALTGDGTLYEVSNPPPEK